jgi:hypothetical protein
MPLATLRLMKTSSLSQDSVADRILVAAAIWVKRVRKSQEMNVDVTEGRSEVAGGDYRPDRAGRGVVSCVL